MASEVDEQTLVAVTNRFGCGDDVYVALSNTLNYAPLVLRKRRKEIIELEARYASCAQHPLLVEKCTRGSKGGSAVMSALAMPSGKLFTARARYLTHEEQTDATRDSGLRCAPLVVMLESYLELFCRRCYRYDCHEHGVSQPLPRKRKRPASIAPAPCCGWTPRQTPFAVRARAAQRARARDSPRARDSGTG